VAIDAFHYEFNIDNAILHVVRLLLIFTLIT
jgi:hypothetical protein